ncbi:MAG TPA: outer membrane beta-barrel protein [Saprospiraceae bacterium]|nr:outer membrane beta-barrel protein [Saprospiraceae bacterium]
MIYRLRPHNVALGVTAGTVWPQVSGAQSSPGFTGGLAGQVAFGEHIRLTGEFRWSRNWFKIKNGDQNTPDIPTLTPPTPDDVLEYVQVKQPSLEYALGLRYQLRPEQKLQPYLALAWAGANTLEQTLQYEFHNPMTETETLVELPYTEQNVFRSRWQFGVGMEWPFGKRLAAGAEAFWQSPIGQGGFLEGSRLGLKANVFYFL